MEDILSKYWAIIASAVAGVVWLVRVEAMGLNNRNEIKRLWAQREADLQNAREARDETNRMLAEIRQDIKELLRKGA